MFFIDFSAHKFDYIFILRGNRSTYQCADCRQCVSLPVFSCVFIKSVKRNEECVCFIAIKAPDDPYHFCTVWPDDCKAYEDSSVAGEIKKFAWSHIDYCGNCGSCGGGKQKVIFGKTFENVCSCTFRVDNAQTRDLPFLKKIIDIRIKY